tara:strand:+ start:2942 stop:3706 length:765 start_codon:yes stop_codon:yes gene_type:complete
MTDCFPEMVMPEEPPAEEDTMSIPDEPVEDPDEPVEEIDYNASEADEEEEEEIIPEPKKRIKIPQDEIFSPPKVKSILEKEEVETGYVAKGRTQVGKGTRKKRGPCTPEQLERLAKGREKAKETRLRKKKEKEEAKAKEKSDKDLVEAVRERERKKLRKKLERPIEDEEERLVPHAPRVQIVEKPVVVEKGYSQSDLDGAVARAVEQSVNRVEVLRKQRKKAKADAQAKANHDAKVFKEINSALKNDVWANCFL